MDGLTATAFPSAVKRFRLTSAGVTYRVYLPEKEKFRLHQIFQRHEYHVPGMEKLRRPLVLDVGANVGLFALYAMSVNPDARVECYEPARNAFELLERNVGPVNGIRIHRQGLYNQTGRAHINISSLSTGQSSIKDISGRQKVAREEIELVEACSAVAACGPVDILKLDTEGCEYEILENLETGGLLGSIRFILLEYHSERDRRRIDALLSGFTLFGLSTATVNLGVARYVRSDLLEDGSCPELSVVAPL